MPSVSQAFRFIHIRQIGAAGMVTDSVRLPGFQSVRDDADSAPQAPILALGASLLIPTTGQPRA